MTNSERNAASQIVEVLDHVAGQAEEVLAHLGQHPEIEIRFQEVIQRYGRLLTPMFQDCIKEAVSADTNARVERLRMIEAQYYSLCQTVTSDVALRLVELAFK